MTTPETTEPPVEQDSRFPSGRWLGFYLQPDRTGRQKMELILTFRKGSLRGEGRDPIGTFLMNGRYDLSDGKCNWTKRYVGKHDLSYRGFNEGKGIWGTWEDIHTTSWRGGFHIWPEAMGDPYALKTANVLELPVDALSPEPEAVGVGAGAATAAEDSAAL